MEDCDDPAESGGLRRRSGLKTLQRQHQGVPILRTLGTLATGATHTKGHTHHIGAINADRFPLSQTGLERKVGPTQAGRLIVAVAHGAQLGNGTGKLRFRPQLQQIMTERQEQNQEENLNFALATGFDQAANSSTEGQVQTRLRSPKALSILATAGHNLL